MGVQYDPLSRRIGIPGGIIWSGHFIVAMWRTFEDVTWSCVRRQRRWQEQEDAVDGDEGVEGDGGEDGYDVFTFSIVEGGHRVELAVHEPPSDPWWRSSVILQVVDAARGGGDRQDVARAVFDRACAQMYEFADRERTVT